jgi:chorismate synthase
MNGQTTGGPIALSIQNLDHRNWRDRDIAPMTAPRPGHADLTGAIKYGHRDLRLSLERASARETALRVAVGAVCRALLAEFGITIGGYVTRIGDVGGPWHEPPADPAEFERRFAIAEQNDVRCPDLEIAGHLRVAIEDVIHDRDTLGGAIEVAALRLPAGLGSFMQADRRLDARLAAALMSVPAVKAVEIGGGVAVSQRRGTLAQDPIELASDRLTRPTNWSGGLEGGISNGLPLVARLALKPIATTLSPQRTVDLGTGKPAPTKYERSDFCQVPRAVAIAEAMLAIVIADALLEKLGGDSLAEMRPRHQALRQLRLADLPMDNAPWRFGYRD